MPNSEGRTLQASLQYQKSLLPALHLNVDSYNDSYNDNDNEDTTRYDSFNWKHTTLYIPFFVYSVLSIFLRQKPCRTLSA